MDVTPGAFNLTRRVGQLRSRCAIVAAVAALAGSECLGSVTITGVGRAQFDVPTSDAQQLSGITYVSGNRYWAVNDHASAIYPLTLGIDAASGALTSMSIAASFQLRDANGVALNANNTDLEGIAYNPSQTASTSAMRLARTSAS